MTTTATPFTALGAGNGFPFCPDKVNVFAYDHWTTLGGVDKSNPATSQELIEKSRKAAMALYWNFEGLKYNATQTNIKVVPNDGTYTATATITQYSSDGTVDEVQPKDRVCGYMPLGAGAFDSDSDQDPEIQPKVSADVTFQCVPFFGTSICAMYNGVTSNESNFVGYGFGEYYDFQLVASTGSRVALKSFYNESSTNDYGYYSIPTNDAGVSMSFVCQANGDITSPSTATASSIYPEDQGESGSDSVEFTSMELYTYAS